MGHRSFMWWADLDAERRRFVTRLKHVTPTRLVGQRLGIEAGPITVDRGVMPPKRRQHSRTHRIGEKLAREIHVGIGMGKKSRLITNDRTPPAEAIADLHQKRWEIELFFGWIEQTLEIRKFLGTSENAVRVQVVVRGACLTA